MGNNSSTEYNGSKKAYMVLALLLTMIACNASSYGNNVALPRLLVQMDAMDYYAVYAAIASMGMMTALPLTGSLSARFGTKNIILFGFAAQFVTRLLMMFTTNILIFGVLYTLAGFFLGLYMAAPYSIMAEVVTPEERPKFFGYVAAASAAGALIGPYMTGLVVDHISAGTGLICYVIFAVIPVIIFCTLYPNRKRPVGPFDFPGLLLLAVFVLCLVMWLSLGGKLFAYTSAPGIILPVAAAVSFFLLLKQEKRVKSPAVPIQVFAKKRFRYTFVIQALIVSYATCIGAYGIVYAQQIMGFDATVSSTITMPQTIVQFLLGLFVGAFVGKEFRRRFRPAGLLAIIAYLAGLAIFYTLTPQTSLFIVYLATGIGGIGQAITQSCYAAFFQTEMTPEEIPPAQGMYQFASTGGSTIFTALCGAAMNQGLSLNQVFLIGSVFVGVALILGFIGFRFPETATDTP